jgi:hypothetical protein
MLLMSRNFSRKIPAKRRFSQDSGECAGENPAYFCKFAFSLNYSGAFPVRMRKVAAVCANWRIRLVI